MDSIDYFYYKTLREKTRPSYDFENLILTAGCERAVINFEGNKSDFNREVMTAHSYFLHEFVHHLQNFSTNWGSAVFADFLLSYSKISVSSLASKETILVPVTHDELVNVTLKDGHASWIRVKDRIKKSFGYRCDEKLPLTDLTARIDHVSRSIVISNNRVESRIGLLVIREHMANLSNLLFLKLKDSEIAEHYATFEGFLYENELTYNPEYWIAFLYFKNNYSYSNVSQGIFVLMNECLTRLSPDEAFYRFFIFWNTHPNKLVISQDFISFVDEWRDSITERVDFMTSSQKIKIHLQNRLAALRKISGHELAISGARVLQLMLQNINATSGGRNIFNVNHFDELKYWSDLITLYGSPIVVFSDGSVQLFGNKKYISDLLDPLLRINSVAMTMKKIHEDPEFQCPFLDDIPICKAEFRDSTNCRTSPFHEKTVDNLGGSCNFRNGTILLSLEDRIVVRK